MLSSENVKVLDQVLLSQVLKYKTAQFFILFFINGIDGCNIYAEPNVCNLVVSIYPRVSLKKMDSRIFIQ